MRLALALATAWALTATPQVMRGGTLSPQDLQTRIGQAVTADGRLDLSEDRPDGATLRTLAGLVELNQVRQLVEDAVIENPESSAVLISDESSPTGVLIDVMDQVRLAGVINIAVSATPEST